MLGSKVSLSSKTKSESYLPKVYMVQVEVTADTWGLYEKVGDFANSHDAGRKGRHIYKENFRTSAIRRIVEPS